MSKGTLIYYWPDDSWMEASEYNTAEHRWKGEDYGTMFVDFAKYATEEEMNEAIDKLIKISNDWFKS